MWVSKSLRSAVNRKYISGILSPDWTRVGAGNQKMSFLCTAERRTHVADKTLNVSDAFLSVELFNTLKNLLEKKLNTTYSNFKCTATLRQLLTAGIR